MRKRFYSFDNVDVCLADEIFNLKFGEKNPIEIGLIDLV